MMAFAGGKTENNLPEITQSLGLEFRWKQGLAACSIGTRHPAGLRSASPSPLTREINLEMLFSGVSRGYRCKSCGQEYADFQPTSILPALLVISQGANLWMKILSTSNLNRGTVVAVGIGLGLIVPYLVFLVFELPSRLWLRKCRRCGGVLEKAYSGFRDGCLPHPIELLVYVTALAIPYIVWKIV